MKRLTPFQPASVWLERQTSGPDSDSCLLIQGFLDPIIPEEIALNQDWGKVSKATDPGAPVTALESEYIKGNRGQVGEQQ